MAATDVARKMGVSYETENAKLKKLVARFALEIDSLKVALGKEW